MEHGTRIEVVRWSYVLMGISAVEQSEVSKRNFQGKMVIEEQKKY